MPARARTAAIAAERVDLFILVIRQRILLDASLAAALDMA
jgi:hypothetical protein